MSLCIFYLINLMSIIITLGLVPVKWLTRKSLSDEGCLQPRPQRPDSQLSGKATPTGCLRPSPRTAGGTCHRNLGVSAEYTSYLPDLPIPVHDYNGAAPGQEGKSDLVGASK